MADTIYKHTLKTVAIMVVFTVVGTLFLAKTYFSTKSPIEVSERAAKMKLFDQVLPPTLHDNQLLSDFVDVPAGGMLKNRTASKIYVARLANQPTAVILEATAQDGYSGDIKLLIAVRVDGSLGGVRVVSHKETPGLGDYIDISHDNWIKSFDGLSLNNPVSALWKVKKDGGQFDYMAGATITPRAVVKATHNALNYVAEHHDALFSAHVAQQ